MSQLDRRQIKERIKNGESLVNLDLKGADLRGLDLRRVDLSGTDLHWADLRKADLSDCDLSGANLKEANLRGALLRESRLRESCLAQADLYLADLSKANLYKAELGGAQMSRTVMGEAILSAAKLTGSNLREARLSGAVLSEADLSNADLSKADLFQADLRKADLRGTDLKEANLKEADLRGTFLRWADLRGANLAQANLNETSLSFAHMYGADLSGANLSDTKLVWTDLSGANLNGVDLAESHLYETTLRRQDLEGVKYRREQLDNMVIERPELDSLLHPEKKGVFSVRLKRERVNLVDFIRLALFFEYYYDLFYVFLYNQYDDRVKLQEALSRSVFAPSNGDREAARRLSGVLNGPPFHILEKKEEGVKLLNRSGGDVLLSGLQAVWLGLYSFALVAGNGTDPDLYNYLHVALAKARNEKIQGALLRAETRNRYAELLKKCQESGAKTADKGGMPKKAPEEEALKRYAALPSPEDPQQQGEGKGLSLERALDKAGPEQKTPRLDCLKTILVYRQEGVLTNKINNYDLARQLDNLFEKFRGDYKFLREQIGSFEIKMSLTEQIAPAA